MTNQPNQTVVIRFIADTQEAITRAKTFRQEVEQIKEKMKATAAQGGQSFKDLAVAMQAAAKVSYDRQIEQQRQLISNAGKNAQVIQAARDKILLLQEAAKQTSTAISTAFSELNKGTKGATGGFSALGQAVGTALGLGTVQIINKVIQSIGQLIEYLNEATKAGYEFAKGMYQLQVGVNALRRAGTDITFGEVLTQLEKLKKEFGIFSTKELVVGASAFLNLNRDMGFTKDQLFELQEAIATLAVVNGRAMDEVQKTVALALSSGYTEGLQRLGVSINRVTIAEEAARLGWDKGYTALTEQQRALATYNLILEKTAVYAADLLIYQETLPGSMDVLTAKIVDLNAKTGEGLLIVKKRILEVKLLWAEFLNWMVENSLLLKDMEDKELFGKLKGETKPDVEYIFEPILKVSPSNNPITFFKDLSEAIKEANARAEAMNRLNMSISNIVAGGERIDKGERDFVDIGTEKQGALTEDQIDAVENAGEKILDLQRQYDIDRRELAIDLERDLLEIKREGEQKREQLESEHQQKMINIAEKSAEQIKDAEIKYDLDVKQTWDEYYSDLASAAEKHSNKLLKIEEDYQEKLKRLKEGFLLDLEDALHERDARQILQLIRRYNLERTQAKRERDQNLTEEERAYKEQLNELDRQRRDRLKKLYEEFKLRTEAIIRQRDRELEEERMAYVVRAMEQAIRNRREKEAREAKYKDDLDSLKRHLEDRLKVIAEDMAGLGITTTAGMQGVIDIMNTFIGPGGISDDILTYFIGSVTAAITAAMGALASVGSAYSSIPETRYTNRNMPGFASGGMAYTDKPTTALFGEAGPEVALFLPLSKLLSGAIGSKSEIPTVSGVGGRDKGKLMVEVLLGAGLEGRIVDKTLNDVADVILRRMR